MTRRGAALLVFASLDAVYAVRLATAAPHDSAFYTWLDHVVRLPAAAVPWAAVGVLCAVQAWTRGCDRAAFAAAIGIKSLWAGLHAVAWVAGGAADGWSAAAVWAAFAVVVWLIAGWPEPVGGGEGVAWTPPPG